MARKKSTDLKHKLSIFLFKSDCINLKDVLKDPSSLSEHPLSGLAATQGLLFVKSSVSFPPKWISFFDGYLNTPIEGLFNSSSSAVVLLKHNDLVFAFTFGYGRSFLNLNQAEESFGLKVALNSIDPEKVRSVDIKNLDTIVRQSKIQTTQAGGVDNFGMNLDRDILNAVTGLSNDKTLGKQISGAMSLHISVAVKIDGLANLCTNLLNKFKSTTYKDRFPWVDHIVDVKNKMLSDKLDSLLVEAIHKKDFEHLFLSVPEIIDWEHISGFKYQQTDEETREDIQIEDILPPENEIRNTVSIGWLSNKEVLCVGANDEIMDSWALYKCLNYEIKHDGSSYILTSGKWFKIDADYAKDVDKEIATIPEYANYKLPEYAVKREDAYNKQVSDADTQRCVLMDKKNISFGGGHSKIEFCDLFIDKKDFVHVKRFRGSACLSHLFLQGHNAAFLLRTNADFLKKVNERLPNDWKFDEAAQIQASSYEVVYAIISKAKKGAKEILPFFSKVSLLQIYRQLRAYGYKVSVAKISVKGN